METIIMFWKKKSRAEIIEDKAQLIISEILISGFENSEIAIIIQTAKARGREVLELRRIALEKELKETVNAINSL